MAASQTAGKPAADNIDPIVQAWNEYFLVGDVEGYLAATIRSVLGDITGQFVLAHGLEQSLPRRMLEGHSEPKRVFYMDAPAAAASMPSGWRIMNSVITIGALHAMDDAKLTATLEHLRQAQQKPGYMVAVLIHPRFWEGLLTQKVDPTKAAKVAVDHKGTALDGYHRGLDQYLRKFTAACFPMPRIIDVRLPGAASTDTPRWVILAAQVKG